MSANVNKINVIKGIYSLVCNIRQKQYLASHFLRKETGTLLHQSARKHFTTTAVTMQLVHVKLHPLLINITQCVTKYSLCITSTFKQEVVSLSQQNMKISLWRSPRQPLFVANSKLASVTSGEFEREVFLQLERAGKLSNFALGP